MKVISALWCDNGKTWTCAKIDKSKKPHIVQLSTPVGPFVLMMSFYAGKITSSSLLYFDHACKSRFKIINLEKGAVCLACQESVAAEGSISLYVNILSKASSAFLGIENSFNESIQDRVFELFSRNTNVLEAIVYKEIFLTEIEELFKRIERTLAN